MIVVLVIFLHHADFALDMLMPIWLSLNIVTLVVIHLQRMSHYYTNVPDVVNMFVNCVAVVITLFVLIAKSLSRANNSSSGFYDTLVSCLVL